MGGIQRAQDLSKVILLRHSRESWLPWLSKTGVQKVTPAGPVFSDAGLLLQAAAAHQGVALGRHAIAEDFLKRSLLVRLFDTAVTADCSYWAVTKKKRNEHKPVGVFIEWLQSQAANSSAP
jgi:LysR family glycine cleavage system transcriptional activator